MENPPPAGQLRIFNQFTETFSVNTLAEKVQSAGKALGLKIEIQHLKNPRKEKEEHYYNPKHTGLLELGLHPNFLTDDILIEMMEYIIKYRDNIQEHKIFRNIKWA